MEVVAVAKKRGPKPQPADVQRSALIAVRSKPAFKAWLERFAKKERATPSQLVELGLVELARVRQFEDAPDR